VESLFRRGTMLSVQANRALRDYLFPPAEKAEEAEEAEEDPDWWKGRPATIS